jgi:hypothetical protein
LRLKEAKDAKEVQEEVGKNRKSVVKKRAALELEDSDEDDDVSTRLKKAKKAVKKLIR